MPKVFLEMVRTCRFLTFALGEAVKPRACFCFGQAANGASAAEATKTDSEFHHPVR